MDAKSGKKKEQSLLRSLWPSRKSEQHDTLHPEVSQYSASPTFQHQNHFASVEPPRVQNYAFIGSPPVDDRGPPVQVQITLPSSSQQPDPGVSMAIWSDQRNDPCNRPPSSHVGPSAHTYNHSVPMSQPHRIELSPRDNNIHEHEIQVIVEKSPSPFQVNANSSQAATVEHLISMVGDEIRPLTPNNKERIASLAPPIIPPLMHTPKIPGLPSPTGPKAGSTYDITKPTCSLNLVCYRAGSQGCVLQQIQTVLESRYLDIESYKLACSMNPQLITTDERFFRELRRAYGTKMCGFWRRSLSLKTLRGLRLLAFCPDTRPTVVPLDTFVLQEMFYAYKKPSSIKSQTDWIEWVFRLRQSDKRHALEFVEGWNSTRVAIAASIPWVSSIIVGIIWTARGGDTQTAFTVASFILTSGTVILALLAFISGIESSARGYAPVG